MSTVTQAHAILVILDSMPLCRLLHILHDLMALEIIRFLEITYPTLSQLISATSRPFSLLCLHFSSSCTPLARIRLSETKFPCQLMLHTQSSSAFSINSNLHCHLRLPPASWDEILCSKIPLLPRILAIVLECSDFSIPYLFWLHSCNLLMLHLLDSNPILSN